MSINKMITVMLTVSYDMNDGPNILKKCHKRFSSIKKHHGNYIKFFSQHHNPYENEPRHFLPYLDNFLRIDENE